MQYFILIIICGLSIAGLVVTFQKSLKDERKTKFQNETWTVKHGFDTRFRHLMRFMMTLWGILFFLNILFAGFKVYSQDSFVNILLILFGIGGLGIIIIRIVDKFQH